jgi:nucleotide-binding universal stress UspA family protein
LIQEQSSILGAVIALTYVATLGSILWWMLHPPPVGDVEQHVRRVTREASRFARVLVPVQGDVLSDRLVALASQMAKYRGATLDVLYLIEVPLTLPITADMEDQQKMASESFTKAAKIADKYDVKINNHVERARQAGPGIVQYARQNKIDLLLMGDLPKLNRRGTRYARTVEYVFENAPCDVIIHRPEMT